MAKRLQKRFTSAEYVFPKPPSGEFVTKQKFSVSSIPQKGNNAMGRNPSENQVVANQNFDFAAGYGDLSGMNQRKGGMCGNCGTNPTRLIFVDWAGGGTYGGWGSWEVLEYYCPECKQFTLVEQSSESY